MNSIDFPFPLEQLSQYSVKNVIDEMRNPERIVETEQSSSLMIGLKAMFDNSCSSILLYRMTEVDLKQYTALITTRDIVEYISEQKELTNAKPDLPEQTQFSYFEIPLIDLRGLYHESANLHLTSLDTNLVDIIKNMRHGIHYQIAVDSSKQRGLTFQKEFIMNRDVNRIYIFSQGDVIQFLSKRLSKLGRIVDQGSKLMIEQAMQFNEADPNQPVSTKIQTSRIVHHLPLHASTLLCFKTMSLHRLSAIAITDGSGKLCANLSVSDILFLAKAPSTWLFKPIKEFIENQVCPISDPVTVLESSTFGDVLELLGNSEVHRAWVVDSNKKAVGCISMSDALSSLIPLSEE